MLLVRKLEIKELNICLNLMKDICSKMFFFPYSNNKNGSIINI